LKDKTEKELRANLQREEEQILKVQSASEERHTLAVQVESVERRLRQAKDYSTGELDSLRKPIDDLQSTNTSLKDEKPHFEAEAQALHRELDELRTEEQAMDSLQEQLTEQTRNAQSAMDEAAALRIQLEQQLLEEKRKEELANEEVATAKQRLAEVELELHKAVASKQKVFQRSNRAINKLQGAALEEQQLLKDKTEKQLRAALQREEEQILKVQSASEERDALAVQVESVEQRLQQAIDDSTGELNRLRKVIDDVQNTNISLKDEKLRVEAEAQALRRDLAELGTRAESPRKEVDERRVSKNEDSVRVRQERVERKHRTSEIEARNLVMVQEVKELCHEPEIMQDERKEKSQKIEAHELRMEAENENSEHYREELASTQERLSHTLFELNASQNSGPALKDHFHNESASAKKTITSLKTQLAEATTKSEGTPETLEAQKGLVLELQAELSKTKQVSETRVGALTQKAKSVLKEVSSLRNELSELNESRNSGLFLTDDFHHEPASTKKIIASMENQLAETKTKSEVACEALEGQKGNVLKLQAELSKTKQVTEMRLAVLTQKAKSVLKDVSSLRNELSEVNASQNSGPALKDHFHNESASAKKIITSLENQPAEATTKSEVTRDALETQKIIVLELQAELSKTKQVTETRVLVLKQKSKSALKVVSSLRNELSELNESRNSGLFLTDDFHHEPAPAKKIITSLENQLAEANTELEVTCEALEAQKGLVLKLQAELSKTKQVTETRVAVLKQNAKSFMKEVSSLRNGLSELSESQNSDLRTSTEK
jgi:chromosome segregation ATPase